MTLFVPARRSVPTRPELDEYGASANVSESALLRGYGVTPPPPVVERAVMAQTCVCGGPWIDPGVASRIPDAIIEHNTTQQHERWRLRMGIR